MTNNTAYVPSTKKRRIKKVKFAYVVMGLPDPISKPTGFEWFSNGIAHASETREEAQGRIDDAFRRQLPGLLPREQYRIAKFKRVS